MVNKMGMVRVSGATKGWRRHTSSRALLGYLFIAPLMLWLIGAILYPLLAAVRLSLFDIRLIGTTGEFVGLDNYARVLSSDRFWRALGRSLLWVLGNGVVQTLLAFITALILNQTFRGRRMTRVWIILSWIVPTVVTVIIWRWLLSSSGVINHYLVTLGLISKPIGFFGTRRAAFITVILINSWRWFPFMAITVLAGLQSIPNDLYEAAAVDGATRRQRFFSITLPSLQPVLFVLGLVGTLMSFNVFDIIWLLTKGGPSAATTTLPVLIYDTAFSQFRLSQAAAISVITGVILLIFALLFIRLFAPKDDGA